MSAGDVIFWGFLGVLCVLMLVLVVMFIRIVLSDEYAAEEAHWESLFGGKQ